MKEIKEIILHCAATPEGKDFKAEDIDRWHKQRGFKMIGYNYVIDLDGTVENGRSIEMDGAHTVGHNKNSIGICYIGGCDSNYKAKDTRTVEQKKSLYLLVYQLLTLHKLSIANVHCHNEFATKACPSFKIEQFRQEYNEWIQNYFK